MGNNTDVVMKKAQQRLYFLRQLKQFEQRREILVHFYRSVTDSILAFPICVIRRHQLAPEEQV